MSGALYEAVARELERSRIELEQLGEALGADSTVLARHIMSLQVIDLIAQSQAELARVVRALGEGDATPVIDSICLAEMAGRLRAAAIG